MMYIPDPQTYRDAAEIIRTRGHFQGYYYETEISLAGDVMTRVPPPGCSVCPMGAIYEAGNGSPQAALTGTIGDKAGTWAVLYVEEHDLIDRELNIPAWADKPGRTQAEVIDLLLKLADGAQRAQEEKS